MGRGCGAHNGQIWRRGNGSKTHQKIASDASFAAQTKVEQVRYQVKGILLMWYQQIIHNTICCVFGFVFAM
jgi:hypothetical protein